MQQSKQKYYFDELEVMLPETREAYLNDRLCQIVNDAYRHALTTKEIFDRAGVRPSQINTIIDLEKLPITRKDDLIELQKSKPPFGGFLSVPVEDVNRIVIAPGPIYEPHFTESISWWGKAFYAAGFRQGDIVSVTLSFHMSPGGILFYEAVRACGATAVPMGVGNTEAQVQAMHDLRVTAYAGTPSFLMALIKRAEDMGYDFSRDFALRRAFFSGEPLPLSIRETLEAEYGISTAQGYGITEVGGCLAYECNQKYGMHLMDEFIIEIVDPATGKQLEPGETGEIVVTPIHNRTWGIIRFGSGDLSSIVTDPCPCGRTSSRLVGILGRTDNSFKVRGMFVIAKQAEQIFDGFDEISRFQIVIGREAQRDEMTFNVELKNEAIDKSKLADDLNRKFQDVCRLRADKIEFVAKGTIPAEAKTIIDQRTWK